MTVTVKHSKTNAISDWTQAQLDEQISLGNFPAGTTLANIVLPSDWNNDHTLTGVGTMAEQNANNVAITGGTATLSSVTTPSVTATTNNLTLSAISTGAVRLQTANGISFTARDNGTTIANYISSVGTSGVPYLVAEGSGTNVSTAFSSKGTGSVSLWTNNASQVQFSATHTASAVNYVQVTGAATTGFPAISAQGSDTNIGITYTAKGSSRHVFTTGNGTQFRINDATSSVNTLETTGAATGLATRLYSQGSDTNISLALLSKGTGAIDLAAGSSGVNISNGGTVTALTRTAGGSAYTSFPSVAISAPTTAGGVQATASVIRMFNSNATIANGGTGYTVGDVLTIVGGTPVSSAATYTVATVSAGVITSVTFTTAQAYSALPTNPVSVTGGTGSGATLNLTWVLDVNGLSITNAGSGYIEQPTVTFSGGGGSGASAYATVGSGTVVKGLGSTMSFSTPQGEQLRLTDNGAATVNFLNIFSGNTTNGIYSGGAATNIALSYVSKGTSGHGFATNSSGTNQQFSITHTASAVNYVQVTGGATGSVATISSQGSDAAVGLSIQSKTASILFVTRAGQARSFNILDSATPANYLQVQGSATTVAPILSAQGNDTNIDLALTPKGTGVLRFGTYTANMALTVQGYIEIKDSGGTLRKLAVIA